MLSLDITKGSHGVKIENVVVIHVKKILQLQNTNLGMSLIASWSKNWALA